MTPYQEHTQPSELSQTEFQALLQEKLRAAVRYTLATILEAEVEAFCHHSDDNVPVTFTQTVPAIFTQDVPLLFGQDVPA
jgi:hypothetical protein